MVNVPPDQLALLNVVVTSGVSEASLSVKDTEPLAVRVVAESSVNDLDVSVTVKTGVSFEPSIFIVTL